MESLKDYISNSWDKAVTEKTDGELVLPHSFVPPCIVGNFRTLFYWDTYFTNIGLICDGRVDLAKNNVDDLLFALEHFGCVPNYTRDDGAEWCSQPPLLSLMVKDIYAQTHDETWLKQALLSLEKEYDFWMRERITPIGLNQYGTNQKDEKRLAWYYDTEVVPRVHLSTDLTVSQKAIRAKDFVAEGESGEDFTPRYQNHNATECVQIDLNCHLYGLEKFLSDSYSNISTAKSEYYRMRYQRRVELLNKYCFDYKTSCYYDYNFKQNKLSNRVCSACFLPYFYGIARDGKGLQMLFDRLITTGGVVACEDVGDYSYQWGFPNIWAPHQFFAYGSLTCYGYDTQAEQLRTSYMQLLEKEFVRTGKIWERYDKDGVAKALEYETQPMLGWTAGVYNYFYLKGQDK